MSRKGDYTPINKDRLTEAFAEAEAQKADYIAVLAYDPLAIGKKRTVGDANFSYVQERAFPVTHNTAAADLIDIFKKTGSSNLRRIYAVASKKELALSALPDGAYEVAKAAVAPQPAKPGLWTRVFGR